MRSTPIPLSRFDLVTLRLFVDTVRDGSLTRGAERASISVPAASKRIAELEAHVGSPLLVRSKRGVVPTPAGQTLLQHAIGVVAGLEQLSVAMTDFREGAGGHLRLWANTSAFTGFLPNLLARYAQANPGVVLDLQDAWSDDTVQAVVRGVAELGIVGDNAPLQGLQYTVCDEDELVLLVPAGHQLAGRSSVALQDVLEFDMVGLHRATSITRQIADAAAGQALKMRVQVRGFDEMCRMIAAGLGVGLLPRRCVTPLVKSLRLQVVALAGMDVGRRLLLVYRDHQALTPAALEFVRLAGEQVRRPDTAAQPASARTPYTPAKNPATPSTTEAAA